ncbi:AtpZ/AtpI family protein [bacterium 1xD42-62]|uniref:AtpZ/AtpI family protein n=1 Tax=Parablautia muri TaxID=2320879 RepID=A0A9X5BGN1_9FIRM|nr:AtpZ/AtpI family protein [Parablautia muri]
MERERYVKFNRKVYQALTMIGQFGINMLVPVFLCSFLGIFLDGKLGTNFFVIVFFFVGAVAGGYNVYRFARGIFASDSEQSAYLHGSRKNTGRGNVDERKNHQDKQDSV